MLGLDSRSLMWDKRINTYEMVAPNTAIKISESPSLVSESTNPIIPGIIIAR